MTENEIKRRFPNASRSFIDTNLTPDHPRKDAVMEHHPCDESLGQDKAKEATAGRFHIRFTSIRKRLCDPDNLCEKWLLDCLRYCNAIDGDEPEKITLETQQRKAAKGEQERTEIEVTRQSSRMVK